MVKNVIESTEIEWIGSMMGKVINFVGFKLGC